MIDTLLTIGVYAALYLPVTLTLFRWWKPNWHRDGINLLRLLAAIVAVLLMVMVKDKFGAVVYLVCAWMFLASYRSDSKKRDDGPDDRDEDDDDAEGETKAGDGSAVEKPKVTSPSAAFAGGVA